LGKSFKVPNNLPGAKELEKRLLSILLTGIFEDVHFGMEATHNYGFHLAEYLSSSDRFSAWRPPVYLNQRKVHKGFQGGDQKGST